MPGNVHMNKGYTLVEAIVALGVLAMVIVMIMPGITQFINNTRNPNQVGQARVYRCGGIYVSVSSVVESGTIPNTPPVPNSNARGCALVRVQAIASGYIPSIKQSL